MWFSLYFWIIHGSKKLKKDIIIGINFWIQTWKKMNGDRASGCNGEPCFRHESRLLFFFRLHHSVLGRGCVVWFALFSVLCDVQEALITVLLGSRMFHHCFTTKLNQPSDFGTRGQSRLSNLLVDVFCNQFGRKLGVLVALLGRFCNWVSEWMVRKWVNRFQKKIERSHFSTVQRPKRDLVLSRLFCLTWKCISYHKSQFFLDKLSELREIHFCLWKRSCPSLFAWASSLRSKGSRNRFKISWIATVLTDRKTNWEKRKIKHLVNHFLNSSSFWRVSG